MWNRSYRPFMSASERREKARHQAARLTKAGHRLNPVQLEGRTIAHTFWGKAWCQNLESYSDYQNRLPRGRSYLRNGSVLDLQIQRGKILATVQGSSLYQQTISIKPLKPAIWKRIKGECAGKIDSLIELLKGRLSDAVMRVITRPGDGLFPQPSEIKLHCDCPDWAGMCKHVAATLYGVGTRLDQNPDLLFTLRGVDHLELVGQAGCGDVLAPAMGSGAKTIKAENLGDIFGIEIAEFAPGPAAASSPKASTPCKTKNSASARKSARLRRKRKMRTKAGAKHRTPGTDRQTAGKF